MKKRVKRLIDDLCKTVGHSFDKGKCSRCEKSDGLWNIGFVGYEMIGMKIYNSAGVVTLK